MRNGFTLVETLVALVLFEFAMLALTAMSAVAARDLATARLRTQARAVATYRVESLRSTACGSAAKAARDSSAGLIEHWRVDVRGRGRDITDSVVFALPRGRRGTVVVRGAALCAE